MQSPEHGVPRSPGGDVAKMCSLPSDLIVLSALLCARSCRFTLVKLKSR
jgi:hypothetical protein